MTEHTLIVPRRNFLVRALGFTALGATVPIAILTAEDAKARVLHHQRELEKAWADYYGPDLRTHIGQTAPGQLDSDGKPKLHVFMICANA